MDFDTSNQFLKFQYWFETVSKCIGYNYLAALYDTALGMSTKFKTGFKKNILYWLKSQNQFGN